MATARQKLAISRVVKNGGNISKSMREAGYSKRSANKPEVLTQSKAWPALMEEFMPDAYLADKHKMVLLEGDDWQAVNAGLDKAYKLKGKYPTDHDKGSTVNIYAQLTDEQLARLAGKVTNV